MEEFYQEHFSASDISEIITPCLATYHLEVGTPVSLNLPTKASFGNKKNSGNLNFEATFPKQERRSGTKKNKLI